MERIARVAFEAARKRNKRLCSVEKSNVLDVRLLFSFLFGCFAVPYLCWWVAVGVMWHVTP